MDLQKLGYLFSQTSQFSILSEEERDLFFFESFSFVRDFKYEPLIINLMILFSMTKNKTKLLEFVSLLQQEEIDLSQSNEFCFFAFRCFTMNDIPNDFLSIREYYHFLNNFFNKVNIDILHKKSEKKYNFIFNHFIKVYDQLNFLEIESFLKKQDQLISLKEEIDPSVLFDYFESKRFLREPNPRVIGSFFNIKKINLFLLATNNFFEEDHPVFQEWLSYLIEVDGSEISIATFFKFYEKNQISYLKDEVLKRKDLNVFSDLLRDGFIIKNFPSLYDKEFILNAKTFDELIELYYRKPSRLLKKTLMSLMVKGKTIDLKYLFLGQIIGSLDVNHIVSILKEADTNIIFLHSPRPFIPREMFVLNTLKNFFPENINAKYFIEEKLDLQKLLMFLHKNYFLEKIPFKEKIKAKNLNLLLDTLEKEHLLLKAEGFDLPYPGFNLSIDEYNVQFPKNSLILKEWGHFLNNCLVYDHWALSVYSKDTVVFGLFKENKLTYCVEVKERKLIQIEGLSKSKPSSYLEGLIKNKLIELDVIDKN